MLSLTRFLINNFEKTNSLQNELFYNEQYIVLFPLLDQSFRNESFRGDFQSAISKILNSRWRNDNFHKSLSAIFYASTIWWKYRVFKFQMNHYINSDILPPFWICLFEYSERKSHYWHQKNHPFPEFEKNHFIKSSRVHHIKRNRQKSESTFIKIKIARRYFLNRNYCMYLNKTNLLVTFRYLFQT